MKSHKNSKQNTIKRRSLWNRTRAAFTIVELLIVVVVIAILASITVVSYNGITQAAKDSSLKSDLENALKQFQLNKADKDTYVGITLQNSSGNTLSIASATNIAFCAQATNASINKTYHTTEAGSIKDGECPPQPAVVLQTITTASCPSTRTLALDARDNRTYWIQKLLDGKCWMLTNLAYAGGGTNTHGDVIPTGDGSSGTLNGPDNAGSSTYSLAKYYADPSGGTLFTTNPVQPSIDTTGGGSGAGRQYGYLYNWCAAMGAQNTLACNKGAAIDTVISICPKNWRLPTGEPTTGEYQLLANAVGATNDVSGFNNLKVFWFAQLGGSWSGGLYGQKAHGSYWSSTLWWGTNAYMFNFDGSSVPPTLNTAGSEGHSVRCVSAP